MKNYLFSVFLFIIVFTELPTLEATYSYNGASHIVERHWYDAKTNPPTSHFNRSMTIDKLHSMATKAIKKGRIIPSKNGNRVHDYQFQRPIGTATNGKKAFTLRVVTNPKGEIVTAFPTK